MEDREQDEVQLPEDRLEDFEPSDDQSTEVAGGGKKLPGTQRPPTIT